MPKIPLINDQYRNVIGNYTNMQDGKYGSQRDQNERIKALASNPGLHSGNRDRKNVAQALVRLISLLNVVSNTTINTTRGIDNSQPTSLRPPGAGSAPYGVVPAVGSIESYEPSLLPVTAVTPIDNLFKRINSDAVKGIRRSVNDRKLNHSKNKKMIHFLKRNKVLEHGLKIPSVSKELLLSGAAHWIYDSDIQENITPLHRIEDIAKCILSESGEYGSKKREKLSHQHIEKVVAHWMFNAILGMSLNEYLISKIEAHSDGMPLTIGEIKNLLKLGTLSDSEVFNMNNVPVEWRSDLVEMWSSLLKKTFPAIYLDDENINDVPIDSEAFSHLYAGARFLKDVGQLHGVSRENILSVGERMWAIALNEGINTNNLVYFLFPSMIFSASNTSRDTTAIRDVNDVERCIHDYIDYRRDFAEIKNDIAEKVNNYQKAVSEWFSKSQLADKVINSCPAEELPYLYDAADPIRTLSQRREKAEINAKQLYMNGWVKPCKTAPESLGDEYQRLTENVADGFREIDRYLIFTALDTLVSDDKKFITSPDTSIYPVSFTMKTNKPMITAYGVAKDVDVHVRLDKADLFSVIHDGEERIYALKADSHDNMLHYNLIRVDRQIERYIDSGILDHNGFESNTVVEGNVLRTAEDTFYFSIFTKTRSPYPKGNNEKVIIDKLSSSHREVLYQRLYAEGNSLSDIQNLWKVIKNFIPFYECISGVANNDPVQAVPSCLLDAFSLIPVIGHALKLSSKFGMGLASGIHKGSHVLRHGSRFTARQVLLNDIVMPKTSELRLLGKQTLNVLDPGFELIGGIGRKFSTELINLLRKDAKTTELAEKIASSGVLERSLLPQKPVVFARFPGSEIEIAMQQVGSDAEQGVYAMVNTDTGEMGGEYFHLQQGNILKGISGVKLKENGFILNERFTKQDRHGERKLPKALKRKTNLLFHYPRRRTEHSYSAPNANLRGAGVAVDVPRLTSFLPLRADFDFLNKEFIDYTEYKSFALKFSFPNTYEEIINMENAFSLMHIQRVSESEIMIPEVFSHFKNNFDLYKLRLNNAMLLVDNVMMEFDTLFHSHTLSAANVNLRDNVINEYLKNVLATESPDVLRNAVERLSLALNKISDYFVNYEEKVYLVTTKRNDISSSDRPKVLGFTNTKDSQKRIVIFTDSFDTGRGYNDDMILTMIHEATHAELGTQDFFYSPYTKLVGDPEDIPEALVEQLTGADTRAPLNLDNQFLDAYATHMGIERPDIESFKQMILNDDMLKANIIMDNADSLSTIIIDIHKLLLPSRVTRNVQSYPSQSHSFDHLTLKALIGLVATESGAR